MRIIFLDVDGVLNCQIHYETQQFKDYREAKKQLKKDVKAERIEKLDYYKAQLSSERIEWLNELCKDTGAVVVISSTWRLGKTAEQLQEVFDYAGGTFKIIDVTPNLRGEGCLRGNEIYQWIKENDKDLGVSYYNFKNYVIIDDDSDMLLWQREHFFQTDSYSGLTPNTCYKIRKFFKNQHIEF
jgi:hypothetical protein